MGEGSDAGSFLSKRIYGSLNMRFETYGSKQNKSIMFIHGMANDSSLFDEVIGYLPEYHVIVCVLDGHYANGQGEFISIEDSCRQIERYVKNELGGSLDLLLGFSLGGAIATEMITRRKVNIGRTVLDAAFIIPMGPLGIFYTKLFQVSIWLVKAGVKMPDKLVGRVFGKGNTGVVDTVYRKVTVKNIGRECRAAFKYKIDPKISGYKNRVAFWHGSNEYFPAKSAKKLKRFLPQVKTTVYKDMGHGQLIIEHPRAYAKRVRSFLEG